MPKLPKQPKPQLATAIRAAWDAEHRAARQARADGDATGEWHHLERAHILSQPLAVPHMRTHVAMLGYGIRNRDRREVIRQLVRLLDAGPGSAVGRYPLGNTGGANVNAVAPMTIPGDLEGILTGTGAT